MTVRFRLTRRPVVLAGIVLVCLAAVTFLPVLGFEFVGYDTQAQVLEEPRALELSIENLKHVFTSRRITSYYPARTLTYMADHALWGMNPGGFKFTNCVIHAANVLLVFWLALRFIRPPHQAQGSFNPWWEVAAAGFPAGVFAVHPVVVESVAWVPGREELLMTLGALGCIHFHVTSRRLVDERDSRRLAVACHAGAALCCAVACLSNAVGAVLPLLITAWDALHLARPRLWRVVRGTAALWVIGAATVAIKRAGENAAVGDQPEFLSAGQLMLVFNVYWLNLSTLIWPTRLGLGYPKVAPESFLDMQVLLGGAAVVLTLVALWIFRRRKSVVFGLAWFVIALGPSSQIMPHHVHRADRFLYLPLAGLVLAVAVGLKPLGRLLSRPAAAVVAVVVGILALLVLEALATAQVWTWQNEITACENSFKLDPDSPVAHCALADRLVVHGQFRRARETYQEALRLHPQDARIHSNYAWLLATCDDVTLRDPQLAVQLATRACELSRWKVPGFLHVLAKAHFSAAEDLAKRGMRDRAGEVYKKAVDEMLQLAILLQSSHEKKLEDPDEAVRLAELACKLMERPDSDQLGMLAEVYAKAGRFEQAIVATEKAIEKAQAEGDHEGTVQLQRRLNIYRSAVTNPGSDH